MITIIIDEKPKANKEPDQNTCSICGLKWNHCRHNVPGWQPLVPVRVGNVYRTKGGGRRRGISYQVIVAVRNCMVHFLVVHESGEIVSTGSYASHVFEGNASGLWPGRKLIGFCPEIAAMGALEIQPVKEEE